MASGRIVPLAVAFIALPVVASAQRLPTPSATAEDFVILPDRGHFRVPRQLLVRSCTGQYVPRTSQWVFEIPAAVPSLVRAIAFRRRDDPLGAPTATPALSATLECWMSHSARSPAQVDYHYSSNRGPDYAQTVALQTFNFPIDLWRADGNYPFTYRIPLDTPFVFQGGTNGLIEMRIQSLTLCTGNPRIANLDFSYESVPPGSVGAPFGTSCAPLGSTGPVTALLSLGGVAAMGNTGPRLMWIPGTEGSSSVTMFFAGTSATSWNGTALPITLDPYGAPGCAVYISPEIRLRDLSPIGIHTTTFDVPVLSNANGLTVHVQGFRFDAHFNPFGVITTNAVRFPVIPHLEASMATLEWADGPGSFGPGLSDSPLWFGGPVLLLDGR